MQPKPSEMPALEKDRRFKRSLKGSPRHLDRLANRPELRKPYILSLEEQAKLLDALSEDSKRMPLFMLNTGCREREVCDLQWAWERKVSVLNTSVFVIPCHGTEGRLVVLNDIAKALIEQQRDLHPTHVFTHKGQPCTRINPFAWKRARHSVGLPKIRVYDLRLTIDKRLEQAGVALKDREMLLGCQKTPDDSQDRWCNWIQALNKVGSIDGSRV